jgi:YidC/Oxa1 family membrane protein insertase
VKEDGKNFILFAALAALILFGWPIVSRYVFPAANPPVTRIEGGQTKVVPDPGADPAADAPAAVRDRRLVIAETPRVRIDTPKLAGSINLRGARIDDLILKRYDETVAKDSPPIHLLSPAGAAGAYFAGFGWQGAGAPDLNTDWTATGDLLSPGRPVTLSTTTPQGLRFQIKLSVDDNYMFTAEQTVANAGGAPASVKPYNYVLRRGKSPDPDQWVAHVGPMAVRDGSAVYVDWDEVGTSEHRYPTTGGWAGFTDHYWLTAMIPDQKAAVEVQLRQRPGDLYGAEATWRDAAAVAPGRQVTQTTRFFAGAKEVDLIDRYESELGIVQFDKAIDWGWFRIIEKPIFYYLDWLFRLVGNFGVAIMLLTLTIRLLLFPIAQKQFASMAGMRALQPKLKLLQEKYKDDKPRLQQEMMQLYKTEKVNPLAGCLPMLLQIPVMFALYKVLILTIEMRHQPFVGWIRDLSAPDPLTPLNLFGLLPFTPPAFIAIGVIPILLGVSMWLQFKLNPQPQDEIQKQMFAIMPWMLMFIMAPFAVGLQVYWITSNVLTMAQQWWLYRQHPAMKVAPAK